MTPHPLSTAAFTCRKYQRGWVGRTRRGEEFMGWHLRCFLFQVEEGLDDQRHFRLHDIQVAWHGWGGRYMLSGYKGHEQSSQRALQRTATFFFIHRYISLYNIFLNNKCGMCGLPGAGLQLLSALAVIVNDKGGWELLSVNIWKEEGTWFPDPVPRPWLSYLQYSVVL